MIDHAKHWLYQGVGSATFVRALGVPGRVIVRGSAAVKETRFMKAKVESAQYVPVSDLPELLEDAAAALLRISPHPPDRCVPAIQACHLQHLPIELVRTRGRQASHDDANVAETAEDERARGAAAASIAGRLARSAGDVTGEDYVAAMRSSPDAALSRQAVCYERTAGPAILTGPGQAIGQGAQGLPQEIPCANLQSLSLLVKSFDASQTRARCEVVDAGEHQDFWGYFDERTLDLDVIDEKDKMTVRIGYMLGLVLAVQLSVTVVLPHGGRKREVVRAGLCGELDHEGVKTEAYRMLCGQLELDLE